MNKQNEIAQYLWNGGTLSVLKALHLFHTTELRKIVSRLKRKGMNIVSELVENLDTGDHYKEYWIAK